MPSLLQFILTCLVSLAAGYAGSFLARGFVSSRFTKRLTELETEVAVLTSEYSKVLALAKKISNRVALDDHRSKSRGARTSATEAEAPPPGASKQELRDFYFGGKNQRQIAMIHSKAGTE